MGKGGKMRIRKGIKTFVTAVTFAVLLFASLMVMHAANTDDYKDNSTVKKYEQQLADYDKKIKDIKNKIASLGNDIDTILEEKEEYDALIEAVNGKIAMTEKAREELAAEIVTLEGQIADKKVECAALYEDIKVRMRIAYEQEEATTLSMIIGAGSFTDFLIVLDYAASILDYDSMLLANYQQKQAELEALQAACETDKETMDAFLEQLEIDKVELEDLSAKCETLISDKMTDIETEQKLLEQMEADKEKKAEALDAYIEELEKIKGQTQVVAEGKYMWPTPVSVSRISSKYGYRNDPFTGERKFHSGIDIPGQAGTQIYASNNGTVLLAETDSSYGKYILIDHGGGVYTLYAHCRKLLVSPGDKVTKGQQIAEMGTTGRSTGNHLHFEVREGKNRVNPLNYVTQP